MCGIIGFSGDRNCVPILLDGLGTLEYRGYDSAGVAVQTECGIAVYKTKGRLDALRELLKTHPEAQGTCGVGHTRWATHGEPSDINSHPHEAENLTLVHNGIIENYAELKKELETLGYTFVSETDTEVAAKWIGHVYKQIGDPVKTLFAAAKAWAGAHGAKKLYISAHSSVESQAFYKKMGCVEAREYSQIHVEQEPWDCQLECLV